MNCPDVRQLCEQSRKYFTYKLLLCGKMRRQTVCFSLKIFHCQIRRKALTSLNPPPSTGKRIIFYVIFVRLFNAFLFGKLCKLKKNGGCIEHTVNPEIESSVCTVVTYKECGNKTCFGVLHSCNHIRKSHSLF